MSDISEFDLIDQYFKSGNAASGVGLGIGDDCALLNVPEGRQLAVSLDTLVGDVHFPNNADPELIAERAVRVSVSDLAAMGAEPLWLTLGLTLPKASSHWLAGFSRGLFQALQECGMALVGGDTTRGPLTISMQVHGAVAPERAMLRAEARVGDLVYVTGTLGDGAGALAVIKQQLDVGKSAFSYLMGRYYTPAILTRQAQKIAQVSRCAIDISDGLLADLNHICKASGVGIEVQAERLPLSEPLQKLVPFDQALTWALAGGDDYQVAFTVAPERVQALDDLCRRFRIQCTAIGKVVSGRDCVCLHNGRQVNNPTSGYKHF